VTSTERLRRLVDLALPKPCEFGEENFAGDPLVRAFCDLLRERHGLDFHVFVAWACPPNVMVVRSAAGSAVIRSERFDTLLIEYYHLRRLHNLWAEKLARDVAAAAVLRWMCEMLIQATNPFRDETLASLPDLERAALQCFSLGHEVGHLLIRKQKNVTLDAIVDGLSLAQHIHTQERQEGVVSDELRAAYAEVRERNLDAANLLNEVEVDLFAFGNVVEFLCQEFRCPVEAAINASLLAFECQSFVYGCKGTCHLLSRAAAGVLSESEFRLRDYLVGVEIVARSRAVMRRAGLVWAVAEQPTPPGKGRDYNAYVRKLDALLLPSVGFRSLISDVLAEQVYVLLAAIEENAGPDRGAWLDSLLNVIEQDPRLRLDMYYILIAFGCSGAVDVVGYLRRMRSRSLSTDEKPTPSARAAQPALAKGSSCRRGSRRTPRADK
jgi:hypothetical protein